MVARNRFSGVEEYAATVVRLTAHALVRRGALPQQDREDVEQELMVDLLRRLPRFDAGRATYRTFVARIVAHGAARLLAASRSENSNGRRAALSLSDQVSNGEGETVERWQTLDEGVGRRRSGGGVDPELLRDLRLDVADVLVGLPPEMRGLCERLLRDSVRSVARSTGTSHPTLLRRIRPIRAAFESAGLDVSAPPRGPVSGSVSK